MRNENNSNCFSRHRKTSDLKALSSASLAFQNTNNSEEKFPCYIYTKFLQTQIELLKYAQRFKNVSILLLPHSANGTYL